MVVGGHNTIVVVSMQQTMMCQRDRDANDEQKEKDDDGEDRETGEIGLMVWSGTRATQEIR